MSPGVLSLIVMLITVVIVIADILPLGVAALAGACVCCLLGLVSWNDIFSTLASSTFVLLFGLSIIGTAMFKTGLAKKISLFLLRFTGKSEKGVILATLLVSTLLSFVCSNTAVVLMLIPIVKGLCKEVNMSVRKVMYPLAAGSGFGGACTLIGTTSNIAGNNVLQTYQLPQMGFFDIAWVGVPLAAAGILYMMTLGRKTLPQDAGYDGDDNYETIRDAGGEAGLGAKDRGKIILTSIILVISLIAMIANLSSFPIHVVALLGAVVLLLTGCVSGKEAWQSMDWNLLVMLSGFTVLSNAMTNSGGAKLLTGVLAALIGNNSNIYVVTAVLFVFTAILTNVISNTACVMMVGPMAVILAQALSVNPFPLVMIVIIAANACYATPIGGAAFTLVASVGRYSFKDYMKMGWPLLLINIVLGVVIIPLVWHF